MGENTTLNMPRLISYTYPGIGDFELPQNILRHIILGHRIHHKVLVSRRPLTGPVLEALLAAHLAQLREHDDDGRVVLPQHPPKVLGGLGKGALGGDVGFAVPITLQERGTERGYDS